MNIEQGRWEQEGFGPGGMAKGMGAGQAQRLAESLAAAARGEVEAYFDLGVACSTGGQGDLVEAHKWFNLAAVSGHEEAQACRAEVAEGMTAREIAEAQKRARAWLAEIRRMAA